MIAESIQEYYAENQLDELKKYVQINALSLNNIYKANVKKNDIFNVFKIQCILWCI